MIRVPVRRCEPQMRRVVPHNRRLARVAHKERNVHRRRWLTRHLHRERRGSTLLN